MNCDHCQRETAGLQSLMVCRECFDLLTAWQRVKQADESKPRGELLLHPNHELFNLCHPMCPACGAEIVPMTPVYMEVLPDGRSLYWHARCRKKGET